MIYRKINATHAETRLYGNIGNWFTNGDSFTGFLEDLESKGFKELTIRMHCYGGSVFEGNVMSNAMGRSNLTINVIIDGVAASMGFFILSGIPKENISIADNAFGMVHRPSSGEAGDADTHTATAKLLNDMEANFIKTVSERSSMSEADVKSKWFDGKDHWLNAKEVVKFGFASKIVKAVAKTIKTLDKEVVESSTIEDIYARFAAVLDKNSINNKNKKEMDLALLIAAFALEGVTADSPETVVLAALKSKFDKQNERIVHLETEAKAKVTNQITALITEAKAAGKFMATATQTVEQVAAAYQQIGETSGVDTLKTVLAGIQTKKPIASMLGKGSHGFANAMVEKNWDWYQKNDPEALQAMSAENHEDFETFREIYKAEFKTYP